MAGTNPHDDLLASYPGATSVDCENGLLAVTYPSRRAGARCPVCAAAWLKAAVAEFIPPRFQAPITLPGKVATWAGQRAAKPGLYLAGQVGTGKTHTAWMATRQWCLATGTRPRSDSQPGVIFTRMTDLLDDLRPGDDSRQRVRGCQEAGLLVIDDLGAEKPSEWTQERLYSIVDHRYANYLPVIFTTNLTAAQLNAAAGKRTASRLIEMCEYVPMTGPDRRRAA